MTEEKISKLLLEQRNITQMMESLYTEIITLQNSIDERRKAIQFLETLSKTDADMDILFSVGGGLYLKALIPKQDEVFANVGAQIYLNKKVSEIIPEIQKVINQLEKLLDERRQALNKLKARYDELSAELTELYFKMERRRR